MTIDLLALVRDRLLKEEAFASEKATVLAQDVLAIVRQHDREQLNGKALTKAQGPLWSGGDGRQSVN